MCGVWGCAGGGGGGGKCMRMRMRMRRVGRGGWEMGVGGRGVEREGGGGMYVCVVESPLTTHSHGLV